MNPNENDDLRRKIIDKSYSLVGLIGPELLVDSLAAGSYVMALKGLQLALEGLVTPEIAFHAILMAVSSALTIYVRPMALSLARSTKSEK